MFEIDSRMIDLEQVIYRDFKSSNVLLDVEFNPKLSDFGLAREGFPTGNKSHVSTTAKHLPDLIPIEQSQYERLKEDRNALEVECAKLREELSQARGEESCHV